MSIASGLLWHAAGWSPGRARSLAEASRDADRRALRAELAADETRFQRHVAEIGMKEHVVLGASGGDGSGGGPYRIALSDLTTLPSWVTAATGAGKSRFVGALMARVVEHIMRGAPVSVVVIDGKDETADQTLRQVASVAEARFGRGRDAALDRVHTFRFFADDFLPSWPILEHDPGVSVEAQADSIAEVLSEVVVDATVGPRQRAMLSAFEALCIEKNVSPVEQPWLLSSARRVEELAAQSSLPTVRLELSRFSRESQNSVDGLVARLNTVLRVPSLKAVFSGRQPFSFRACLEPGRISVFSFGGAPAGARQGVRAVGSLVISALANAAFDPKREVRGTTLIVIDEPPAFLTAVSTAQLERLVTLGRSFGAGGLMFVHQGATQLPLELQTILNTNVVLRCIGRSSEADAMAAGEWLARTGVVPRPRTPGARHAGEGRFLSEGEERRFRVAEVGRLPARHFVVADRRVPAQPRIVRAHDYNPPAWSEIDPEVAEAVRCGAAGYPRAELERRVRDIENAAAARFEEDLRNDPGPARRRGRAPATPDVVGRGGPGSGEVP